jgi:hypothetical protein
MGGLGSGRFGRRAIKQKIEHSRRQAVDIRDIRKALIQADSSVLFYRPALGGVGADYAFMVEVRNIHISYKTPAGDGEWKLTSEKVALETTPCRYGGSRFWFRCPACGRRTATVYLIGWPPKCRICLHLKYGSQSAKESSRIITRMLRIQERFGCSGSRSAFTEPSRIPGMHHRTYDLLISQLTSGRLRYLGCMADRFNFFPNRESYRQDYLENKAMNKQKAK